ncbi:MAG: SDR family NAD(P)-dependent oxidoreductase, partial [Halioglobus sp.]
MTGLLENKVALVTGGGSGIGAATAHVFHRDGANVVIIDRDGEAAERVRQEILEAGGDAIALEVDVSVESEMEAAITRIVDHYGALHAASNNAAFGGGFKSVTDWSQREW